MSSILIVTPDPLHREVEVVFVATLWDKIEEIISSDQDIEPARVRRIGVKNRAVLIFVKNA
jgi:hypothetical protein